MPGSKRLFMTAQRRVILEELKNTSSHPTAEQIFDLARARLPRISLGTVYRNLEILAERGMIQQLAWAGTQKRYDGNPESHYHVRCLNCGRVQDIMVEPLAVITEIFERVCDYEIVGHRLEALGLCRRCLEKSRNV
ncbi:MAG: transcriptional repressor [Deltaproteobacteria bacterium]|nr:transcriptional repressor [Deltaproteobacteria bacterium]